MESQDLDMKEFKDKGPLVMQNTFRGDVKHALQDARSKSIQTVAFDVAQNSIVTIGTQIEQLEEVIDKTQGSALEQYQKGGNISQQDRRSGTFESKSTENTDGNLTPSARLMKALLVDENLETCFSDKVGQFDSKQRPGSTTVEKMLAEKLPFEMPTKGFVVKMSEKSDPAICNVTGCDMRFYCSPSVLHVVFPLALLCILKDPAHGFDAFDWWRRWREEIELILFVSYD
ncbi:hypothetical protein Q1695_013124 [Nippostrongylus brasiliensis]|nr:hypothetical protein Q1695_013124 [Nippostrongylus brasiliensis]